MTDFKSKFPSIDEITSIAGKFYKDMKTSVCEIIKDYQEKREEKSPEEKVDLNTKPVKKTKKSSSENKD